jgi:WD40 repeat protein
LRTAFADEPRHLDVRWAHDEHDLNMRNSRFRDAVAQLAAPVHGVARDELESEDIRLHKRARRLARTGVSALAILVVIAIAFGGYAIVQRNRANTDATAARRAATIARNEARVSDANRLAIESENLEAPNLPRSLLLAVEARRLDDTPETRSALLAAVQDSPHLVATLPGFGSQIGGMALTPDGHTIVIGGFDGKIRLVDLATRRLVRTWTTGTHSRILTVSISPNGKTVATTDIGGTGHFYDLRTGRPDAPTLRDPGGHQLDAAGFSPDGTRFFASSHLYNLSAWMVNTGHRIPVGGSNLAGSPALSNQDRSLPAFTADGDALIEPTTPIAHDNLVTGATTYEHTDMTVPPRAVAVNPTGSAAAMISPTTVEVIDPNSGRLLTPRISVTGAWGGAFSPDGKVLAITQQDGDIAVFNAETGARDAGDLVGHSNSANSLAFTPDGQTLVSASADEVAIWDLTRAQSISTRIGSVGGGAAAGQSGGYGLAVTPDGKSVLVGADTGVDVMSTRTPGTNRRLVAHTPGGLGTTGVAIDPAGRDVLTGGDDGDLVLSEVSTGKLLDPPMPLVRPAPGDGVGPTDGTWGTAISPSGRFGAVGTGLGTVVIVDLKRWRVARTIHAHTPGFVIGVAFNPQGDLIASDGVDGLSVNDVTTGRQRYAIRRSGTLNLGVAFSPDGTQLAVGFGDGTAQLLNARTGIPQGPPLDFNRGLVGGIAYSPDGNTIAFGQNDGTIFLVDAHSGQTLGAPLTGHTQLVVGVAFTPDGQHLASTGYDGTVRLWNLDTAPLVARACTMAGRNLTPAEWAQYLPGRPYHATCPTAA